MNIIGEIQNFIKSIIGSDIDILFFIGLGLEILFTVFYLIKSRFSYEMRVVRKLLKINNWLNKNRFVNQDNLIEFNNMMKHTPKHLRYYWHQYMLNRDKEPSYYMSTYNLVEKPLKSSAYSTDIKDFTLISCVFAGLIFLVSLIGFTTAELTFNFIAKCLITPFIMLLICAILTMIMRMHQNMNINSLYQYVHYFGRFLDRAVTTMPEYVDFEVLFTRKEIKQGIPVLNEYLEKRARQEQEELEKARINAVEHENYDFSSAGINGALVLERAINESETYINIRSRLLSEIQQLEDEIETIKRTYENSEKDYQKKLQVSKENVDRLRKQQEETTNRIENNYIKKQQADEIKKQEQLEKDNDAATIRFNQELETLTKEIETRRKELEDRKKYVEDAMKAEYQTFSTKLYKSLSTIIDEEAQDEKDELIEIKDEIAAELQQANDLLAEKDREILELQKLLQAYNIDYSAQMSFASEELRKEAKRNKKKGKKDDTDSQILEKPIVTENNSHIISNDPNLIPLDQIPEKDKQYGEDGGFYDANGYYRYANGSYFKPTGEFYDDVGGWYEADGVTYHAPENANNVLPNNNEENAIVEEQQPIETTSTVKETHRKMEDIPESEREYGEDGGFYDSLGYYYYPNGTFYTPDKRYFDENGGWYEADGVTYHEPENMDNVLSDIEEENENFENNTEVFDDSHLKMEDVPEEDRDYKEDGGFFDKKGYYFYPNGAYFTPDGRYFDENGGWYEADGVTYHNPEENVEIKPAIITDNKPDEFELNAPRYDDDDDDDDDNEPKESASVSQSQEEMQKLRDQFNIDYSSENDEENQEKTNDVEENVATNEDVSQESTVSKNTQIDNNLTDTQENIENEDIKEESTESMFGVDGESQEVKDLPEKDISVDDAPINEPAELQETLVPEAIVVEQTAKRGRGRPRKEKKEDDTPKVKRGRGRPKKEIKPVEVENDDIELFENVNPSIEQNQEQEIKRGRGRPKKVVEESTKPAIKRSRGRPKKVIVEDNQVEETPTIKRSRGRPKKSVGGNDDKQKISEFDDLLTIENAQDLQALNKQIESEHKKLTENQEELDKQLTETLFHLDNDNKE